MSALSFSFLPGIGFSLAATSLVGQSIGAGRPREGAEMAKIATLWAVLWMSAIAVLFFVFATPIMRLFTAEPEVIRIGAAGLRGEALARRDGGGGRVQSSGLRGSGDARCPQSVGSTGVWCAVLLAWLALTIFGGGLPVVWGAFLLTSPITSTLTWRRFRRRVREMEERSN
jgi:Na+-driven multidrug efflux pump